MSEFNDNTNTADAADSPGAANGDGAGARQANRETLAVECPAALAPWRAEAYGDTRDDLRAALSAGSDTADDLVALELALRALADDPSDLDAETRQRALQSAIRQLHARTTLLIEIFDYLWLAK